MKKCFLLKETHKTTVFMHQLVLTKKICWRLACFKLGINFRRSLMVSVGVSALGRTAIHFIDPGVKVNGHYYREVLLKRYLFPEIRNFQIITYSNRTVQRLTQLARQLNCLQRKLRTSSHRLYGLQTVLTLIQLTIKSRV